MKVILFGATGMIGGGTLRECLEDPAVQSVLVIGRQSCGVTHPKLREIVRTDLFNLGDIRAQLAGYDACLFCLGVSSVGMSEDAYRRITLDLTLAVATTLSGINPGMAFCYVSGQNTDSTEKGSRMWARVKGETENRLLELPLRAVMLRPGYIQPMKGVRSKTAWYQAFYNVIGPLYPVLRRLFPGMVTNTETLGRALLAAAAGRAPHKILETADINRLGSA